MRPLSRLAYALALAISPAIAGDSFALDVFATSFFSPAVGDPDPGLTGVLRIDLDDGSATTFIAESPGGLLQPSDVAVSDDGQTLYVSSQSGVIWHYDATTGAPLPSNVDGAAAGTFAVLPTAGLGDGFNALLVEPTRVYAATAFGSIARYDADTGLALPDLATGLPFPSGIARAPSDDLLVSVGDPFGGPGAVFQVTPPADPGDSAIVAPLIGFDASPSIRGASNPTIVPALGDYDEDGVVATQDYVRWLATFGTELPFADGNGNGEVDAGDYTIFRDNEGAETRLVIADLNGNRLVDYALDGTDGEELAVIPPDIPDPLPPTANPAAPSNSPSEVLVTPEGNLLVSTLGLTRRPDNRGALLEFARDGTLLRTIASDLPPLSGIAFAPEAPAAAATPEPTGIVLAAIASLAVLRGRR